MAVEMCSLLKVTLPEVSSHHNNKLNVNIHVACQQFTFCSCKKNFAAFVVVVLTEQLT